MAVLTLPLMTSGSAGSLCLLRFHNGFGFVYAAGGQEGGEMLFVMVEVLGGCITFCAFSVAGFKFWEDLKSLFALGMSRPVLWFH